MHPPLLAGLVLILCLGMTWQLWHGAEQARQDARQAAFELRAREAAAQLSQRVSVYVQLLRGVQSLFASSQIVTRGEFADFVFSNDLDRQLPGVQAIGYMSAVPGPQRAAHEAAVRAEGVDGYGVWPAGARSMYAPMTYIEPLNNANARLLGYDGWHDPVRRAMLAQARDSGQATTSGPLTLLQHRPGQALAGFVIALPVYRNGAPRLNTEQRRAALAGWVVAPFSAHDVLAGLDPVHTAGLKVELVQQDDGLAGARERVSWHTIAVGPQLMRLRISETAAGTATGAGTGAAGGIEPLAIGLAGLAVTALLTLMTFLLARSSVAAQRALRQARILAQELDNGRTEAVALADAAQCAQAMLRSVLDSTAEGILVDDGNGRILVSNQRFRELWRVPAQVDLSGDEMGLLEHMAAMLVQPAPFLHGHSLPCRDTVCIARLLLGDGRYIEQTLSPVRLGTGSARLWSYREVNREGLVIADAFKRQA